MYFIGKKTISALSWKHDLFASYTKFYTNNQYGTVRFLYNFLSNNPDILVTRKIHFKINNKRLIVLRGIRNELDSRYLFSQWCHKLLQTKFKKKKSSSLTRSNNENSFLICCTNRSCTQLHGNRYVAINRVKTRREQRLTDDE